jgi:hypothetical protein
MVTIEYAIGDIVFHTENLLVADLLNAANTSHTVLKISIFLQERLFTELTNEPGSAIIPIYNQSQISAAQIATQWYLHRFKFPSKWKKIREVFSGRDMARFVTIIQALFCSGMPLSGWLSSIATADEPFSYLQTFSFAEIINNQACPVDLNIAIARTFTPLNVHHPDFQDGKIREGVCYDVTTGYIGYNLALGAGRSLAVSNELISRIANEGVDLDSFLSQAGKTLFDIRAQEFEQF